jgi:hypothetical protein
MCNFYVMYYVDGDKKPSNEYCFTAGPPDWHWNDFSGLEAALAPLSASIIPGTKDFLAPSKAILDNFEKSMDRQHERMQALLGSLLESEYDSRSYGGYGRMAEREGWRGDEGNADDMYVPNERNDNYMEEA